MDITIDDHTEHFNIPLERPELAVNYATVPAEAKRVCDNGCYVHITPSATESKLPCFEVPEIGKYTLTHCVVRMPSEHTVNHKRYPLEVQCHHTMDGTDEKRKGVLSTLYEATDKASGFIGQLETQMPNSTGGITIKDFSFSHIGTAGLTRYHSYAGSQTIGDCKEDADWYIMYDPTGVTQAQLDKLSASMTWMAPRPQQNLYGRHPEGCHHHHEDGAATACLGMLSFALALISLNFHI